MAVKLSGRDWDILVGLQLNADVSTVGLAKRLRCKEHVIRHALRKFRDLGLIARKPFLDLLTLGFQEFAFYFSLAPESHRDVSALLKDLRDSPQVAWLVEFSPMALRFTQDTQQK